MKTTLRELFWVVTIAAVAFAWYSDRQNQAKRYADKEVIFLSRLSEQYDEKLKAETALMLTRIELSRAESELSQISSPQPVAPPMSPPAKSEEHAAGQ